MLEVWPAALPSPAIPPLFDRFLCPLNRPQSLLLLRTTCPPEVLLVRVSLRPAVLPRALAPGGRGGARGPGGLPWRRRHEPPGEGPGGPWACLRDKAQGMAGASVSGGSSPAARSTPVASSVCCLRRKAALVSGMRLTALLCYEDEVLLSGFAVLACNGRRQHGCWRSSPPSPSRRQAARRATARSCCSSRGSRTRLQQGTKTPWR